MRNKLSAREEVKTAISDMLQGAFFGAMCGLLFVALGSLFLAWGGVPCMQGQITQQMYNGLFYAGVIFGAFGAIVNLFSK